MKQFSYSRIAVNRKERGGVMVEFSISFSLLAIVLFYCFDIGQRVGQLSWASQINYVVTFLGSETSLEQRTFIQNKLIREGGRSSPDLNGSYPFRSEALLKAQNRFWKMKPLSASNVTDTARPQSTSVEYTKIQTHSQGIWNPILGSSNMMTDFSLYTINNLNAITHSLYQSASNIGVGNSSYQGNQGNVLRYDWCGRLCGGSSGNACPSSQDQGYVQGSNGSIQLAVNCP